MEYELTPHLKRLIIGRKLSAFLSIVGVPLVAYNLLPFEGAQFWIAFAVVSSFGIFFLFKLLEFLVVKIVYGSNKQLMHDDAQSVIDQYYARQQPQEENSNITQVEFTIEELPEKPVGKYYDADIYEWIKVRSPDGKLVTAYFEDTINPKQMDTYPIPDGHMLIPPGILFKLEDEVEEKE